jgi:hypothetical protein
MNSFFIHPFCYPFLLVLSLCRIENCWREKLKQNCKHSAAFKKLRSTRVILPDWVWQILLKRPQRGRISVDFCYYCLQKHGFWKIRNVRNVKPTSDCLKYYKSAWVFKEERLCGKVSNDLVRKERRPIYFQERKLFLDVQGHTFSSL